MNLGVQLVFQISMVEASWQSLNTQTQQQTMKTLETITQHVIHSMLYNDATYMTKHKGLHKENEFLKE